MRKSMEFKPTFLLILFIILAILGPVGLWACPGCNAVLNEAGQGINYSVLFMMAMPFLVFGSIAVGIIYVNRQKQEKKEDRSQIQIQKKEKSN